MDAERFWVATSSLKTIEWVLMGRKSSSKGQTPLQPATAQKKKPGAALLAVIVVAIVGVGVLAFWRGGDGSASSAAPTTTAAAAQSKAVAQTPTPDIEA